jgi:hypothetical protein
MGSVMAEKMMDSPFPAAPENGVAGGHCWYWKSGQNYPDHFSHTIHGLGEQGGTCRRCKSGNKSRIPSESNP